jgi:hypothetical protein
MKYQVVFLPFTERHYIKSFAKKYLGAWDKTRKALTLEFTLVDLLFQKTIAEVICISPDNNIKICKTEFKVLGTDVSRHASGYRCIIAIHVDIQVVNVLLVYGKGDVEGRNETAWWQNVVKDAYSQYKNLM